MQDPALLKPQEHAAAAQRAQEPGVAGPRMPGLDRVRPSRSRPVWPWVAGVVFLVAAAVLWRMPIPGLTRTAAHPSVPAASAPPSPSTQAAAPPVAAPIKLHPGPPADDPAIAHGEQLLERGLYREAIAELKLAVSRQPQSVAALLALGNAYLEADQAKSAVKPLQTAAELDSLNPRAQLLLGTAWQSLGKNVDAAKAYRRYLELDPGGDYAHDVRLILENLLHSG
jgi:Flp pilus assembly protein TadD